MTTRELTPLEARVLAVLVEKEATVPDTYPLSLNTLVTGCNQKTARDPVMQASEAEVAQALDGLKSLHLVNTVSGNRVLRFAHNMPRGLNVPSAGGALLMMLVLRGPQTAAELKLHTERLHRFADTSSVEAFLEELAAKEPARVVRLPRGGGERETRWAHLLCGAPLLPAAASASVLGQAEQETLAELKAEVASLRAEVAALRADLMRVQTDLGITPADPPP